MIILYLFNSYLYYFWNNCFFTNSNIFDWQRRRDVQLSERWASIESIPTDMSYRRRNNNFWQQRTIKVTEETIVTSANLAQPSKAEFLIDDKLLGMSILFRDEQPRKTKLSIEVTEEGIVICWSDEQHSKADASISVTEGGIVICSSEEQFLKAEFPILTTEEGIVIFVNDEQHSKVEDSMNLTLSEIWMLSKAVHL